MLILYQQIAMTLFTCVQLFVETLNPNFCEEYDYPTITYRDFIELHPDQICCCTLCNTTAMIMYTINPFVTTDDE